MQNASGKGTSGSVRPISHPQEIGLANFRQEAFDWHLHRAVVSAVVGRVDEVSTSSNGDTRAKAAEGSALKHATAGAVLRVLAGTTANGIAWRILNGDVHSALDKIPAASIDCVVTSPPYYWQRDYEVDGQIGHEQTIQGYVEAIAGVFTGVHRVLADDGVVFLNLGDTYYSAKGKPHGRDNKHNGRQMMRRHLRAVDGPGLGLPRKSLIGIPWRVALTMQNNGWTLRSSVIWERPGSLPEPTAHDRPWRTYEHVFIFSKGPRYYFNRRALNGGEDVWRIVARPENPGAHFAPYPRELVDRCLDLGCKPRGRVLDPFVGSGTTVLCALARRSPAIGIDLKPEYCNFIVERVFREFAGGPLNGIGRGLLSTEG